jgi:hypothetical protein
MTPKELTRTWQLTPKNGNLCINPDIDTAGFYGMLQRTEIESSVRKLLPSACDLFEEARFFLQLLTSLEVCEANRDAANWCLGAHLVAYIGINDAAEYDFGVIGRLYREAPLQKEFGLKSSDPNPFLRDPVAINKLYRDLRNIRTHFGERLLEVTKHMQLVDIGAGGQEAGLSRWYLRDLKALNFDRLRKRNVTEFEIQKITEFYNRTPLVATLCQSLVVMAKIIGRQSQDLES